MKKRNNALFSALPIVAAAYAERFGVKVHIGGDTAYTDGRSINLPNIPEDYPHKDALWGYLAHEGAHVRFTDFSVPRKPGIHAGLTNIIEDCRIEQLMIKAYPGTNKTLLETAEYMLQAGHFQVPTTDNHPAQVLSAFCLYFLRSHGLGQAPLLKPLKETDKVFRDVFPHGSYVRINALLRECIGANSTQDAADLAVDILKMIKEEEEKEKQKSQQEQSSDDQDEDQDDSQGSEQGQGNSQSSDQDDSQDDSQGDDQGQGSSQGDDDDQGQDASSNDQGTDEGQGSSQGQSSDVGDSSSSDDQQSQSASNQSSSGQTGQSSSSQSQNDDDLTSITQQILSASGDDLLENAHESLLKEFDSVAKKSGDSDYCTVRQARQISSIPGSGDELLSDAKSVSAGIRQQLNGLVQATQRQATRHTRTGRKISTSRLARVRTGETRVFTKSTDKVAPNTAVHILLDMSGSMCGDDATIAKEAAISIALALETIRGVNPAVTFFNGDSESPVRAVVSHGERVKADKFYSTPSGTTPMAEAVWYAAFELSKCKEERKLIICITDGAPNNHEATHKILDLCKASGVETIGIGIRHNSVRDLFDNSIVINKSSELRTTLFQLMKDSLVVA